MKTRLLVASAWVCVIAASAAQDAPKAERKDNAADVKSIDSIVAALYDTISGEKAQQRDWDRLRALMAPEARFIIAVPAREAGQPVRLRHIAVEDFIKRADESSKQESFYEREVARRVDQFGAMANVWSTYESRRAPNDTPFSRGINSLELFNDGTRWWVVSIYWTFETPQQSIPDKYLSSK